MSAMVEERAAVLVEDQPSTHWSEVATPVAGLSDVPKAVEVATEELKLTLSPRLGPRDSDHIRVLAECIDDLPPILVHGTTREVVDGVHRVLAARLLNRPTIRAFVRTGSTADAYLEAVQANVSHGKPLSLAERRAAARRILTMYPEWSDRRIGEVCGLASHSVATLRGVSLAEANGPSIRVGRDGRARPADPAAVRRRVAELLGRFPEATLREIAAQASTSQATVLDVKRRIVRGEDPLPRRLRRVREPAVEPDVEIANDHALKGTDGAREFLEWFESHRISRADLELASSVPIGRIYVLADQAKQQAAMWAELARALEARAGRPLTKH